MEPLKIFNKRKHRGKHDKMGITFRKNGKFKNSENSSYLDLVVTEIQDDQDKSRQAKM